MRRTTTILLVAGVALAATACTDSKQAAREATWGDRPADITCWTYGTQTYDGRSTGKVEYDRGGRIAFVDAANGRYTTVEGDCRVVYLGDGDGDEAAAPASVTPAPAAPASGTPAAS
jgi:hypothetical protein